MNFTSALELSFEINNCAIWLVIQWFPATLSISWSIFSPGEQRITNGQHSLKTCLTLSLPAIKMISFKFLLLHHAVWRTWFFHSLLRWKAIILSNMLPHLYVSLVDNLIRSLYYTCTLVGERVAVSQNVQSLRVLCDHFHPPFHPLLWNNRLIIDWLWINNTLSITKHQ